MPERPKGADCKSAGYAFVGSNPTLGTSALLAQLVEHFHGKEEVSGSSPEEGSKLEQFWRRSSVGKSARLIIVRSAVQVCPPLLVKKGEKDGFG